MTDREHPSVGMRFGRYELVSKLGVGGMGEVFRARDHDLSRDVAIKFLPRRFAGDPIRLGRFSHEARAASALNHPNIVTIHEIGETSGLPYIVMELIEGQTVRTLLRSGALPVRRALEIATQLADGLAKAHTAGITHRDLKPENLMVTDDGFVKILDFGLAKLRVSDSGDHDLWFDSGHPTWPESPASPQTAAGAVLGTVGYMSPEQAQGRAVDFRSDQFAFGAIVYEMATGRQAFHRETPAQTITAIIESSPEPLAALAPVFPPPARWIVDRCLQKDPADRYASTLDLARELRTVRDRLGEGWSGSIPKGGWALSRVGGWSRRRGWIGASVVLAALLALFSGPLETCVHLRLPGPKQVAVLPFTNTGGAEAQAFCDGVVETLSTKLTQLERFQKTLWVVPASEVRAAGITSAAGARRAFGVTLVVTGSVQRTGDTVRLTGNLVNAGTLRQLRAVVLDARRDDPTALQDAFIKRVADMLDLEILPEAGVVLAAGETKVGSAWELYVEGRGHLQRYEDPESVDRAVAAFQAALQRDPEYALAYAGLGEAHWRRYQLSHDAVSVDLARRACEKALSLNDLLAPVHVTLGIVRSGTGEADKALADFERALALDPGNGAALLGLARAYERLDRAEEAEATYVRSIDRQPAYWGNHSHLGAFYWRRGRYEDAEKAFRRVTELVPDNARGYSNLGVLLAVMGREEDAIGALRRSLEIRPSHAAASNLATLEFKRGRYDEAAREFERALQIDDRDYRLWRNLGAAYYWAHGERGRAAQAYRRAAELAEKALAVDPRSADVLAQLADCHAMLGESSEARRRAQEALDIAPDDVEVLHYVASAYEKVGDRDAALRWLGRALEIGHSRRAVEEDPGFDQLRADPRYGDLVKHSEAGPSLRGPAGR